MLVSFILESSMNKGIYRPCIFHPKCSLLCIVLKATIVDAWSLPDMTLKFHIWIYNTWNAHRMCIRSSQPNSKNGLGRSSWGANPFWGAIGRWCLLGKGESVFYKGMGPMNTPILVSVDEKMVPHGYTHRQHYIVST